MGNLDTKDKTLIGIISTFFIGGLVPILPSLIQAGETNFVMVIISIVSGVLALGTLAVLITKRIKKKNKEKSDKESDTLLNITESVKCRDMLDYLKYNDISLDKVQEYLKIIPFIDKNMLSAEEILTFIKIKETLSHRNITMGEIIDYLHSIINKPSLTKHKLFISGEHKFLQKAITLGNYNENEGQCWVISMYHILKIEIVINRIKTFLLDNEKIIMNDLVHLNVEPIKTVIWDSINGIEEGNEGYETIALKKYKIPDIFIREYNKIHDHIVNLLENAISLINQACYTNDYNRYLSILNAVYLAFEATFTEDHIKQVFNINGRLNEFYKEVKEDLDRNIKVWKRSYI